MTGHHIGTAVSIALDDVGEARSFSLRWTPCRRRSTPVGAASWWASTTSVRSASGSPVSATTFQVVRPRGELRRAKRLQFAQSSAIAAAAPAPASAASAAARPASAASAGHHADGRQRACSGAYPSRYSSSSTVASQPAARSAPQPVRSHLLTGRPRAALELRELLDHLAERRAPLLHAHSSSRTSSAARSPERTAPSM